MNPARRREMVDREHPSLPIVGQCALLGVSRSSLYYHPKGASEEDLSLMREIDRQYLNQSQGGMCISREVSGMAGPLFDWGTRTQWDTQAPVRSALQM